MRATCLILLSTCEASPEVVCPVSVQEGCGEAGEDPARVSQDGRGPGAPRGCCGRWAYLANRRLNENVTGA